MTTDSNSRDPSRRLGRRGFLTGAALTGAGLAVGGALAAGPAGAEVLFPTDPHGFGAAAVRAGALIGRKSTCTTAK